MNPQNQQLPSGYIGFALGIAGMLVSLYFSIQFITGNASGAELIAGIVFCLLLDYGKVSLSSEAMIAMAQLRLLSAVCYTLIVICLYGLSMMAATFMLTNHATSAIVEQSDSKIATLQKQVADKQAQLEDCNPNHLTKCVNPRTAELEALQGQLTAAQNVGKEVLDAKDRAATWDKLAKTLGTTVDDLQIKLAFARAILLEIISPIFVSMFLAIYRNRMPQSQTYEKVINETPEQLYAKEEQQAQPPQAMLRQPQSRFIAQPKASFMDMAKLKKD